MCIRDRFLAHLKYQEKLTGPSLVIAPLSVLSSWLIEFKKFCPSLRVVKLHSSDEAERERLKKQVMYNFDNLDVVVTTYEMAKSANMSAIVSQLWWRYLILDEGLSLIHISEPTRLLSISYAVFCLKKKKNTVTKQ
eukprot:TRINITY_DN9472_c0_g1_i1.p1 TRINITY_DN9472_c0_g1~~TRINITY_DN9472_c0_g1_i1.p1  ORF type:complete len:136 (-),score=51.97 TRINITY_DN9472_c0_g1_i1:38-445(-)